MLGVTKPAPPVLLEFETTVFRFRILLLLLAFKESASLASLLLGLGSNVTGLVFCLGDKCAEVGKFGMLAAPTGLDVLVGVTLPVLPCP